ncbi:MAG: ThiF family adenylyltransferase [Oscillospiraceae bacterium]|jgi:hypothetical protein|nr:ThiF family adenylyltransferase [Oscillospiraceae bacterium]
MKFNCYVPVKIILLGAGGTGGYIAPHLYRVAHTLARDVRIIIADGDVVEKKNLIRQNFAPCDVGGNKAEIMARRYSGVFGMETEYIPNFIENEENLQKLLLPQEFSRGYRQKPIRELVILIGAVDNNRSRQMCHRAFLSAGNLIYIDSGNGEYTGQIVCGVRRGGRTMAEPIGALYPDVLTDDEKFPTELSCAERSVSAPQSISANLFASTAVASLLYNLLVSGNLDVRSLTFSSRTLNIKSILRKK